MPKDITAKDVVDDVKTAEAVIDKSAKKNSNRGKDLTKSLDILGQDRAEIKVSDIHDVVDKKEAKAVVEQAQQKGRITASDVNKVETKAAGKAVIDSEKALARAKKVHSKLGVVAAIGMTTFASATILDISKDLNEKKKISRDLAQQEKQLQKKQNEERKAQKSMAYGAMDLSNLNFDLFENRVGHYKMGNSKYY